MVPRVVPTAVAALGLVLALVGLVMLTVASPPQQVGGSTTATPVLVTGPGVLALTGSPVEVSLDGEGFVGLGRADEVAAWLSGVDHTRVDGVGEDLRPTSTAVPGDAPGDVDPVADPGLADIWVQEQASTDPTLRVPAPGPDQAVVAVGRTASEVSVVWQRPATHPGAWPLLVLGLLQTVLALVWLVALNRRRARGSRATVRPARPAGVRR